jgi:hypothetical protein
MSEPGASMCVHLCRAVARQGIGFPVTADPAPHDMPFSRGGRPAGPDDRAPLASPDHAVFERWIAEQGRMCGVSGYRDGVLHTLWKIMQETGLI